MSAVGLSVIFGYVPPQAKVVPLPTREESPLAIDELRNIEIEASEEKIDRCTAGLWLAIDELRNIEIDQDLPESKVHNFRKVQQLVDDDSFEAQYTMGRQLGRG